MSDFGATYDEMESAADKLDDHKGEIDEALDLIQSVITDLTEDGFKTEKASGKYKENIDEVVNGLKQASESVPDAAQALRDMAQMIRDTDDQMSA